MGKLQRHDTVLHKLKMLKIKYTLEVAANCPVPMADTAKVLPHKDCYNPYCILFFWLIFLSII